MRINHPDIDGALSGEEPLRAVGHWLKEVREQRGESLEDVSKVTRIGKSYLEALEEGAASRLPSPAYSRGFIRLYASHLGLSPDDAIHMLATQPNDAPPPPETAVTALRPQFAGSQPANRGRATKIGLTLVGTLILAGIVLMVVNHNGRIAANFANTAEKTSHPPVATSTAAPGPGYSSSAVTTAPATPSPLTGNAAALQDGSFVLRLKAVSAGRLHITIDGSISQEYDLVAGDLVEWKAEQQFLLDLENAGSVEADLDGKPLQPLGEAGKAAHLIIRQNGVQQN